MLCIVACSSLPPRNTIDVGGIDGEAQQRWAGLLGDEGEIPRRSDAGPSWMGFGAAVSIAVLVPRTGGRCPVSGRSQVALKFKAQHRRIHCLSDQPVVYRILI